MNDPSPFTLLAFMLAVAKRRGVPWTSITGTSNQSDYISHFIANHMFYRLSLPGARRVLLDHIEFCREHVPGWNPVSVVGQHMQQAGATPVETMAFTISTALQYAQDCIDRGMDIDDVLRRFTFFFDISISFFEEVAKFRAGRRIWARMARERLGAKDPALVALQIPRPDLRRRSHRAAAAQQYRARRGAGDGRHHERTAIVAHRRLRRSDHHADRGDRAHRGRHAEHPARGGASVRRHRPARRLLLRRALTDQMEAEIEALIGKIDAAGGMYQAAETGLVQSMIGESALAFQEKVESGEEKVVGVNCYQNDDGPTVAARPSGPTLRA